MVDIHTHVLPQMDDGAKNVQESLDMLKTAYQKGVRLLAATPHCHVRTEQEIEHFLERREQSFQMLRQGMEQEKGEYPQIVLGAEVALNGNVHTLSNIHKLCIGTSKHILLEPQIGCILRDTSEWIHTITVKGITPIIAHINRYTPEGLEVMNIFSLPVVCQINAEAFLNMHERHRMRHIIPYVQTLVLGSDMHNTDTRPFTLDKAYKKIQKMFPDRAENFVSQNALQILKSPGGVL